MSKAGTYELSIYTMAGQEGRIEWKLFTGSPAVEVNTTTGTAAAQRLQAGWNHVVATYDGTTARNYINGVERTNKAVSGTLTASYSTLMIGRSDRPLAAKVDEVAVYGTALSPERVLAHSIAGVPLPPTPTVTSTVTATSSPTATPPSYVRFYDDFNGSKIDTTKWMVSDSFGIPDQLDGSLRFKGGKLSPAWSDPATYSTTATSNPGNYVWTRFLYQSGSPEIEVWEVKDGISSPNLFIAPGFINATNITNLVSPGSTHTLKLAVAGDDLATYLDDVLTIQGKIHVLSGIRAGVTIDDQPANIGSISRFEASNAVAATP